MNKSDFVKSIKEQLAVSDTATVQEGPVRVTIKRYVSDDSKDRILKDEGDEVLEMPSGARVSPPCISLMRDAAKADGVCHGCRNKSGTRHKNECHARLSEQELLTIPKYWRRRRERRNRMYNRTTKRVVNRAKNEPNLGWKKQQLHLESIKLWEAGEHDHVSSEDKL